MKISICIPQYNRSAYLLLSLQGIAEQTYDAIEVVISDDCSTDDTETVIQQLATNYRYPIIYHRFDANVGYDRNTRKSLELATGEYCFILGNDDTLHDVGAIERLVVFLKENNFPEIGFCNSCEYDNPKDVQTRAAITGVIGTGEQVALQHYSSFSFIAGIIFNKNYFETINTDKADKSIYFQLYLCTLGILKGGRLFTIAEPMVLSHISLHGKEANSYKDTLPKTWKAFKPLDGGLPNFAYVSMLAFRDAGLQERKAYYSMIRRIYSRTYPYWLMNYRKNNSFVGAWGLFKGLTPAVFKEWSEFSFLQKIQLRVLYILASLGGLMIPVFIFNMLEKKLYRSGKKTAVTHAG